MKPWKLVVFIALAGVLGWAGGACYADPSKERLAWEEDRKNFRDSLNAFRTTEARLLAYIVQLHERESKLLEEKDNAVERADALAISRARHKRVADSLSQVMASLPAAEQLPVCLQALAFRANEAADCGREVGELRTAIAKADTAKLKADSAKAVYADSLQKARAKILSMAVGVIDSVPDEKGCPLPFCAALDVTVELWDKALFVGVTIPFKQWLRIGPVRRVLGPEKSTP